MAGPAAARDEGNRIIPSYACGSAVAVAVAVLARTLVSVASALDLTLNPEPGTARVKRLPSPGVGPSPIQGVEWALAT